MVLTMAMSRHDNNSEHDAKWSSSNSSLIRGTHPKRSGTFGGMYKDAPLSTIHHRESRKNPQHLPMGSGFQELTHNPTMGKMNK